MSLDLGELEIRLTELRDAQAFANYYRDNAEHLANAGPTREPGFDSLEAWHLRLRDWTALHQNGRSAHFVALDPANEIVACCNLSNIVYDAFMACHMGYGIAQRYEGQGLMTPVCLKAIDHAFRNLGLNRIMANYIPTNERSGNLLARLGFVVEGRAARYLKINGVWQDHVLTSLINPKPVSP